MNKAEVLRRIAEVGIIPVIRASSSAQGMAAIEAVCSGGIPIVEITMTVPGAVELIETVTKSMGEKVLVGAGTVLDAETAARCLDAGARFLVSPRVDEKTIRFAVKEKVLMLAGALTPSEIVSAWEMGSDLVKVFPCGQVGGAKYIQAIKGPFPQIPLVPTGGVNLETAASFIEAGAEALGVGSELVQAEALNSGKPEVIAETARKFLEIVARARAKRMACQP